MILCLVEHESGAVEPASLEALALGRQLTRETGGPLEAAAVGAPPELAETLRQHGVSALHSIQGERLADYVPEAWAAALDGVVDALAPRVVLAAGSERGNELMAHIAAARREALATNVQAVATGEPLVVVRQRWGGSLLEEAELDGGIKLLTTAAGAFKPTLDPVPACATHTVTATLPDSAFRIRRLPGATSEGPRISLGEARLVIGGGRGVGSAEGFRVLEELAAALGGVVGCSRAVTSNGWRPHAEQIGQTGERITADLYIACGISGAMQHIVGAKGARRILAINTDPDATIMNYADYAIIGDLHEVVPAITAAVRQTRQA